METLDRCSARRVSDAVLYLESAAQPGFCHSECLLLSHTIVERFLYIYIYFLNPVTDAESIDL